MKNQEPPVFRKNNALKITLLGLFVILGFSSKEVFASLWQGFSIDDQTLEHVLQKTSLQNELSAMIENADKILTHQQKNFGLANNDLIQFAPKEALADEISTTLKYTQTYRGLEVIGREALFHFNKDGELHDHNNYNPSLILDTKPKISTDQAQKILADRYQESIMLTEPASMKIFTDFEGSTHLVYLLKTKSTEKHRSVIAYVDAHSGNVVLETDRMLDSMKRTVYSANTEEALQWVDYGGYPMDINVNWYKKSISNGKRLDDADESAIRAYDNAGKVYNYFKRFFYRKSFDNKDSPIVTIVHMGEKMNNAFWTDEYKVVAFGDGDGEHFDDFTLALDVAGHELTHALVSQTSNLIYAGEPGALNESYADFFGKMIDSETKDWDLAAKCISPKWGRRALRNLLHPEEFGQPNSNDSPTRIPSKGPCTSWNDRCGVHTNSGIPSRAAALIVEAIGRENTQRLYYHVLVHRLNSTSNFADARRETETACAMFYGVDSFNCKAVTRAFDTVKM